MGVICVVVPLDDQVAEWLASVPVVVPTGCESREPTLGEVEAALADLTDVEVELSVQGEDGPRFTLSSGETWTILHCSQSPNESNAVKLSFHKGSAELMGRVLRRLARDTGPLVLVPDTGDDPTVYGPL